jgi:hypothetical protein
MNVATPMGTYPQHLYFGGTGKVTRPRSEAWCFITHAEPSLSAATEPFNTLLSYNMPDSLLTHPFYFPATYTPNPNTNSATSARNKHPAGVIPTSSGAS